jgi:Spermine/spermidine synthase domain
MLRAYSNLLRLVFLGSALLPAIGRFEPPITNGKIINTFTLPFLISSGALLYLVLSLILIIEFHRLLVFLQPIFDAQANEQLVWFDSLPERFLPLAILGSAAVSLALELSIIRWQGTVFQFFAFYKNYGLLACFAGLGLGYALARNREVIPLAFTPALCAWQFALLLYLRFSDSGEITFGGVPFREQLNMGVLVSSTTGIWAVHLLLAVVFLLTALAFIPVGQLCGRLMERGSQLSSYGWNLLGSLAGVALVFLMSFLWTPPIVWFSLCFLILIFFFTRKPATLLVGATLVVVALIILAWPAAPLWNKVYSPYQLLEIGQGDNGLMVIRAAGNYYQRVHDFSRAAMSGTPDRNLLETRNYYDLPYRLHPGQNDVAIVGAGSGNDVAAALRSGAAHVDAVEIDPAILSAGRAYHPEHPYSDPRVRPILDDARSFFRNAPGRYDLIVYGLLDSHTLLSHASSVRLDSFVYTVEGLREARARLKENGVLSLSFCIMNPNLGTKIFQMMRSAFGGKDPICISAPYDGSVLFIQSKNGDLKVPTSLFEGSGLTDISTRFRNSDAKVSESTDDWPFFYMPRRIYPFSYLVTFAMLFILSVLLYRSFLPDTPQASHLPFLFLGAGFMLVETKAITELGLTFGNTWQVIAIAIASILFMAFLGNGAVQLLKIRSPYLSYLLLFFTLILGWWVARIGGLPSTVAGRVATAILLTSPLFFSGIVFSTLLGRGSKISSAMSLNLIGAMCGGILEYNSMYFGFRMLYLLALGLYAAALLSSFIFRTQSATASSIAAVLVPARHDEGS